MSNPVRALARSDRYFRLQRTVSPHVKTGSDKQHRHIVALLRAGKRAEAVRAMREHIEWNRQDLRHAVGSMKHEPRPVEKV